MFGIVTATLSSVTPQEKERYQAAYCGLCRALKERYGQASRAVLSYDLTFYVLLCNALHEPAERTGSSPCVTHPLKPQPFLRTKWTDRAADLAVALAYHKCLDDIHDDGTAQAKAAERLMRGAYERARERIPEACAAIEAAMADIRTIEQAGRAVLARQASDKPCESNVDVPCEEAAANLPGEGDATLPIGFDPDAAGKRFGQLLGLLLAEGQGLWAESMLRFGALLGRLIYMMDAAVDYADDAESGSYNPFVALGSSPADMQLALATLADPMADAFERLPIEQDLHLLRSIVYAGVWQKFNQTYQDAELPLAPVEQ